MSKLKEQDAQNNIQRAQKVGKVLFALAVAGFFAAVVMDRLDFVPQNIANFATILTFVVTVSAVIVTLISCKCPFCNKQIFFNALNATYCPHCKRSLSSGKKVKKSYQRRYR